MIFLNKLHNAKLLLTIAIPLMTALLAQRAMQFIDTVMMGWIGPTALAAGAIGTAIFATILLFCMGTLTSIGVYIARAKGAGNISDIPSTVHHGYWLILFLTIPSVLLILISPYTLLCIGENPVVVENTRLLLNGMVWGFPGILLFLMLREYVSAFAKTMIVMLVSLCSIPLTFAANYILIYGKYHFPALGIAGIGYGSATVMWFMFLALLTYSKFHSVLKVHLNLKMFTFNFSKFKELLSVGLPSGTVFLLEAGLFLTATVMMGYFGIASLAAHQIALQWANIAYTLPPALSIATTLQVSHALGANNLVQAKKIAITSLSIGVIISAIIMCIFIFATHFLVDIFLEKNTIHFDEAQSLATLFLKITAMFLCFDAVQSIMNGALRGLRDTFIPMLISLTCYWILGMGSAYLLSMHTHLAASGIWYGLTLGLCSVAIVLTLRFFKKIKKMILFHQNS